MSMIAASAAATPAAGATTIVIGPGQSIQRAVNHARPGDTIRLKPGVYHQSVQIRTNGITLRGSGASSGGTVLEPPKSVPRTLCNAAFGPSGICILARDVTSKGVVIKQVRNDTVTGLAVTGFAGNGVFGYGTEGMTVTWVAAVNDGGYGISRFSSTRTLFAHDIASGNSEAGFYVGDSPDADTVVRDNVATGNQSGIFVRHAREVRVVGNRLTGNCQGIFVLDDGQPGGAGNVTIAGNRVFGNNKLCPAGGDTPVTFQGGGILLLGATHTTVAGNRVAGNAGQQLNSGGIVVVSAKSLTHGSNPNFDTIVGNRAHRDQPADLIWDGSGTGVQFAANHCGTSIPGGLCH
jgi:hypothetical protein